MNEILNAIYERVFDNMLYYSVEPTTDQLLESLVDYEDSLHTEYQDAPSIELYKQLVVIRLEIARVMSILKD